jgi:hypothetical protein
VEFLFSLKRINRFVSVQDDPKQILEVSGKEEVAWSFCSG